MWSAHSDVLNDREVHRNREKYAPVCGHHFNGVSTRPDLLAERRCEQRLKSADRVIEGRLIAGQLPADIIRLANVTADRVEEISGHSGSCLAISIYRSARLRAMPIYSRSSPLPHSN